MKTLKVYGASDDLIEASGIEGADEFGTTISAKGYDIGRFIVEAAPFSLEIHAFYAPSGTWCFAVGMVDEDMPLPPWTVRIGPSPDCPYSTELQIDVPDHATMRQVRDKAAGAQG